MVTNRSYSLVVLDLHNTITRSYFLRYISVDERGRWRVGWGEHARANSGPKMSVRLRSSVSNDFERALPEFDFVNTADSGTTDTVHTSGRLSFVFAFVADVIIVRIYFGNVIVPFSTRTADSLLRGRNLRPSPPDFSCR